VSLSRDPAEQRLSAVARKRKRHPNAGARWTADDQARLVQRHHEGASVEELMRELGRNRGGILSRLVQLGELPQEHWPPSLGDTDEGGAGQGGAGQGGVREGWAGEGGVREGGVREGWAGEGWASEGGVREGWAGEGGARDADTDDGSLDEGAA
jgi:hypothetical protein